MVDFDWKLSINILWDWFDGNRFDVAYCFIKPSRPPPLLSRLLALFVSIFHIRVNDADATTSRTRNKAVQKPRSDGNLASASGDRNHGNVIDRVMLRVSSESVSDMHCETDYFSIPPDSLSSYV